MSDATIPEFVMGTNAVSSLDVTKHYHTESTPFMTLVTEPLEYGDIDGTFTPNLAEEVTEPTPTSIVYRIREGVKFSDGTPLTVDDVVWSLQRLLGDTAQTKGGLTTVTSIEATGELEVTVNLSKEDPGVRLGLIKMGQIHSKAFGEANAEALGSAEAMPVGTGPYVYTSFGASGITMERNPHYWGEKPAPDTLSFEPIPEDTQRQLAMRSESIQGAVVPDLTKVTDWESIPGTTLYSSPTLYVNVVSFDTTKPPFDDVHLRRAVAYSIDREGLLRAAYGESGTLLHAYAPKEVVAGGAPTPEEAEEFLDSLPQYGLDPDEAKAELAQSAYADGLEFEVTYIAEHPWAKLVALNMQQNLAEIGVTAKPVPIAYEKWLEAAYAENLPRPTTTAIGFRGPEPSGLYTSITPGPFNTSSWNDPEVVALAEDLYKVDARWEAAKRILTKIADDAPYVPLFQAYFEYALADGFTFTTPLDRVSYDCGRWIHLLRATA